MINKDGQVSMPVEKIRWDLAERFGWTLDYIDALEMGDFHEFLQVQDGISKSRGSLLNKQKKG
jgi:hypothetical protein